jgi:hypothetical protein
VVKPIASWSSQHQVWIIPSESQLFEQWALYQAVWPKSGMTVGGQLFELAMPAHLTAASESSSSQLPTPLARDWKESSAPHKRNGVVQTDNVPRAIFNSGEVKLMGTPRVSSANGSTAKQVAADAPKKRIEDQVLTTSWGKFEPAIREWELITRPAPAPTLPDGKDGGHRLHSKFSEWMMGLPDGWITGHGLKRNDELKMCGNGVVPAQAEMALRILLEGIDIPKG